MSQAVGTVSIMSITIDCGTCSLHHSAACGDCVVTFILSRSSDMSGSSRSEESVVVEAAEFFALRRLQSAGLVPELRHEPIASSETG